MVLITVILIDLTNGRRKLKFKVFSKVRNQTVRKKI